MKGLITKEFIVLFKTSRFQLALMIMFAILGIFLKNPMYVMMIPLLLPMLAKQELSIDEICKWDKYAACFPVERKNIVGSKYFSILAAAIVSLVMVVVCFMIMSVIETDVEYTFSDMKVYVCIAIAESLILPSLAFPFDFKFGTAKGRIMYFIFVGLGVVLLSASTIADQKASFLAKISEPSTLMIICLAASAVVFAASLIISTKIYEAKEI